MDQELARPSHQAGTRCHQQKQRPPIMAARDLILHDFWLKSFSLVLAVMVWLAVHANIRTESSGSQNPFRLPEQDKFPRPIVLMTDPNDHQAYVVEPVYVIV